MVHTLLSFVTHSGPIKSSPMGDRIDTYDNYMQSFWMRRARISQRSSMRPETNVSLSEMPPLASLRFYIT
jgi:hypothetical protein